MISTLKEDEAVSELKIQNFRKIKFVGFVMLSFPEVNSGQVTGHRNALNKG